MKKILLIVSCLGVICLGSCKKDRDCKCTITHISASGNTTTDLDQNTTYEHIGKSDAKSKCQNYTTTYVDNNGGTTVTKGECKLN